MLMLSTLWASTLWADSEHTQSTLWAHSEHLRRAPTSLDLLSLFLSIMVVVVVHGSDCWRILSGSAFINSSLLHYTAKGQILQEDNIEHTRIYHVSSWNLDINAEMNRFESYLHNPDYGWFVQPLSPSACPFLHFRVVWGVAVMLISVEHLQKTAASFWHSKGWNVWKKKRHQKLSTLMQIIIDHSLPSKSDISR